jgi:hypothetical protein
MRSAEAPVTSWITSLIRIRVPSSTPFISETRVAFSGRIGAQSVRFSRRLCEGTVSTTRSASAATCSGSVDAVIDGGSSMPGR